MDTPQSLKRNISPPPTARTAHKDSRDIAARPDPADVEAGKEIVIDHIDYWCDALTKLARPRPGPRLSIADFRALYQQNQHAAGHHFVVHQHDHPVSGVHYDLRLQISPTSSLSFAIPYGLPGNANSARPNRMAIETRVHNLWNNLIESASYASGSLLIWDTGEYEIMPRPIPERKRLTDDELSAASETEEGARSRQATEPTKLAEAFQSRHMHIRLHGTRLPPGYTIAMRLPRQNYRARQPKAPKRRRTKAVESRKTPALLTTDSESGDESSTTTTSTDASESSALGEAAAASDDESRNAAERETIRQNNAYPGATNNVGSVHQRHWFLSLDRESSGFGKQRSGPDRGRWIPRKFSDGREGGFEPFFVMGREVERSIITGRQADDVMGDANVNEFKGRKMWRPIVQ